MPAIVFSLLGVLWLLPVPGDPPSGINWATVLIVIAMILLRCRGPETGGGNDRLRRTERCGYPGPASHGTTAALRLHGYFSLSPGSVSFVGHVIEGRRPSFFSGHTVFVDRPAAATGFLVPTVGLGLLTPFALKPLLAATPG